LNVTPTCRFEGHFLLEKSAAIASSSYFDKRSQPSDAASLPRISSAVSSFGHKQTISSVNKCARSGSLDESATYSVIFSSFRMPWPLH
jgi:hypothetical protein